MCGGADVLAEAINRIRLQGAGELKGNYFFGALHATEFRLWLTERSLAFVDRQHDFGRLHFMSRDLTDLADVLRGIPERPLVADYVTRSDDHHAIETTFREAGFVKTATYRRMVNDALAKRSAASNVVCAQEHEAAPLFERLCRDFDVRLDRIPAREQFVELVRRGHVLVHRQGSEIDAYVVYQLQGRRAHLNYWHAQPGSHPAVALKLLTNFFSEMATKGVRSSFLWVEAHKPAVTTIYQRFGYKFDGMIADVHIKN